MTPQNYPQNLHTQKKIFILLKTPKNIEIQNFDPKKMTRAYVCMKISEYPPPPHGTMPRVCLQYVIVVFSDHTHLPFLNLSVWLSEGCFHTEPAFVWNMFQNGYLSTLIDVLKHSVRLPEHGFQFKYLQFHPN